MERRMAEFLVHERVPWEAFIGVAAANDARCRDVESVLGNVGVSATVRNRPNWYFP
jgi:ssDNA thymidine ADP-ribosyltransferase, DarT